MIWLLLLLALFCGFVGLVLAELGGENTGTARDSLRLRAVFMMVVCAAGCAVFGWAL